MPSPSIEIPFNELYRGRGADDATDRILEILESLDYDFVSNLYDEALSLAREGHLGRARDRLRMLLTLEPDDGRARLLLAKIFASQRKWSEALSELDAAAACGVRLPMGIKDAFEGAKREAEILQNPAPDNQTAARAQGEVTALREETRRLRSEKTRLERALRNARERVQIWTVATAVMAGLCILGLGLYALSGDSDRPEEEALADVEIAAPGDVTLPVDAPSATDEPATTAAVISKPTAPASTTAAVISKPTAPASTSAATVGATAGGNYTVVSGDNLWIVAGKVYGDSTRWKEIHQANQGVLGNKIALQIGMELKIPRRRS